MRGRLSRIVLALTVLAAVLQGTRMAGLWDTRPPAGGQPPGQSREAAVAALRQEQEALRAAEAAREAAAEQARKAAEEAAAEEARAAEARAAEQRAAAERLAALQTPAETPEVLPEGEAREEVFYACTACHSSAVVRRTRLSRERWDELMDWMTDRHGMNPMEADQRERVVDYLARNFGPQRGGRGANPFATE